MRELKTTAFIAVISILLICCALPAAALPASGGADSLHPSVVSQSVGDRFGVASSHLKLWDAATMERELDAATGAGIGWVRCDFAWSDLEPVQGAWNFAGSDMAVAKAEEHGVDILGILAASPPWANGGNEWNYPPTDLAAWSNYVRTVCLRYKGKVTAWEIWNEENIDQFWMPVPDSAHFVQLLQLASAEIRAADPDATIVMGGVAGLGSDYLDECLAAGAAEYIDAIAYHPYAETIGAEGEPEEDRYKPKEELCRWLADVFVPWLVSLYSAKDLEVWITEVGWNTCQQSPPGVDHDTQAAYLLRTLINYATTEVSKCVVYSLRDDPYTPQDEYGLLEADFAPKKSYHYYSTFSDVFGEALSTDTETVSFVCSGMDTLEAHCFTLPGGRLALAVWKSDDHDDQLNFSVNDPGLQDLKLVDPLTGERREVAGVSRGPEGKVQVFGLPIGRKPVIVELGPGTPMRSTFYFAEGYTGDGFHEYLCLGNMDDVEAEATVTFLYPDGSSDVIITRIPTGSRTTIYVNSQVGKDKSVSAEIVSRQEIVAERPMYFNYKGVWAGGHDAVGANYPSRTWYFAEGYTGAGFDEWICVLNTGDITADLTLYFQTQEEGQKKVSGLSVTPHSRASFKANDLLGGSYQNSLKLESSMPVVAERPMYFDYSGTGGWHWQGGHCVMGATSLSSQYFFAEGTTRGGFEEWITLQNPNAEPLQVQATYQLGAGQGNTIDKTYDVPASARRTIYVPDEVGTERDVSVYMSSSSDFLAERPMYFSYGYQDLSCRGGHCVIGAACSASEWFLAEGYTGSGYNQWLCLQNPGDSEAVVEITYYTQEAGLLAPSTVHVPAKTRSTVMVNRHAGSDYQLSTRIRVTSGPPIVVERPMYFAYSGWDGGHDVVGYVP